MSREDLPLNQMGLAVMLLDRKQLPLTRVSEKLQLNNISNGKVYVLKEQAKVFLNRIPNPLLRKYFCTIGSGQGIVVRIAPAEKKPYYDLSPFFKQALENVPTPKGDLTDEVAELYVGKIIRVANRLRGQRRSSKSR
jgi:hypothetical protein